MRSPRVLLLVPGLFLVASFSSAQIRTKTGTGSTKVRTTPIRVGGGVGGPGVGGGAGLRTQQYKTGLTPITNATVVRQQAAAAALLPASVINQVPANIGDVSLIRTGVKAPPVFDKPAVSMQEVLDTEFVPEAETEKSAPRSARQDLGNAVKEIEKGRPKNGGERDVSQDAASLDKIFDKARRTGSSPVLPAVAGKTQDVAGQIKAKVSVANIASPHDAPRLYVDAIQSAEKTLTPSVAGEVKAVVKSHAAKKAKTSLESLANDAFRSAEAGVKDGVDQAFDSMAQWSGLLDEPGRPLVKNQSRLQSYVGGVLNAARPVTAGLSAGDAEILAGARKGSKLSRHRRLGVKAAASQTGANKIWFSRDALTGGFTAMFPGIGVAKVPAFPAGFSLKKVGGSVMTVFDPAAAFAADPSLSNGISIIFKANRDNGASTLQSALAAVSYGAKAAFGGLWYGGKTWLKRTTSASELTQSRIDAFSALDQNFLAASRLMAVAEGTLTLAEAQLLLENGKGMAQRYETLTGDASGVAAFESLERRVALGAAKNGLTASDVLTPELTALVSSNDVTSARSWLSRIHTAALTAAVGDVKDGSLPGAETLASGGAAGKRTFVNVATAGGTGRLFARYPESGGAGLIWVSYPVEGNSALAAGLEAYGFGVTSFDGEVTARYESGSSLSAMEADVARTLSVLTGAPIATPVVVDAKGLERLLTDVKRGQGVPVSLAQTLQSYDPAPYHYTTIGRVGSLEAQSSQRRSKDGRPLTLIVLRDPDQGHIAFARVEWAGSGRPLSVSDLEAALP